MSIPLDHCSEADAASPGVGQWHGRRREGDGGTRHTFHGGKLAVESREKEAVELARGRRRCSKRAGKQKCKGTWRDSRQMRATMRMQRCKGCGRVLCCGRRVG